MSSKAHDHRLLFCVLVGSALAACSADDASPPQTSEACETLQASCPAPRPTFSNVAPIFGQRCATPCHSGTPNGPWPLATYEHIFEWQNEIKARLTECAMPPPGSGVSITTEERLAILSWIECGAPE
jgi:uncharacterized membrane protein